MIEPSPLVRSGYFTRMLGSQISLKLENLQETGAFKVPGGLVRREANVSDAPGAIHAILGIIARKKAKILHVVHDRLDLQNPIGISRVVLNLETRGHDRFRDLVDKLRKAGYPVKQIF